MIEPPEYFDDHARSKWWQISKTLEQQNRNQQHNAGMVEAAASAYSRYREAHSKRIATGIALVTKDDKDQPVAKRNPFAIEESDALGQYMRALQVLALSSVDLVPLEPETPKEPQPSNSKNRLARLQLFETDN